MPLKPRDDGSGKLNTGRPTKYRPEYCDLMIKYFTEENDKLPFFSAFARMIGITEDTIVNWTNESDDFLGAYKTCKAIQKELLISRTLSGQYNPTFAIFTAKNLTDMRDVQETQNTLTINIADYLTSIPERTIDANYQVIDDKKPGLLPG